jgi:iron(III) transport system substrate-binding protein
MALLLACLALVAACQRPAPAAQPTASGPAGAPAGSAGPPAAPSWDQLVEAARKEGVVNLYAGAGGNLRGALVEGFEPQYPGIKVEATVAPGNDIVNRVLTERTANKFIADVILGQTTSSVEILKPAGALAPLKPALILPEVLDTSAWLDNRLWWTDAAEPYTNLRYQGTVQVSIFYNPQLVDPRQFTSYRDLLDPKWKGKIVSSDLRRPGAGAFIARFMYKHPDLGGPFLERLYSEMDVTLGTDQRQMVDWVAQGAYPIGLFLSSVDAVAAVRQGLPLAAVPGEQIREGAPIGPGGGALTLADGAPHPNAARVFINWVLSREGQVAWQRFIAQNSLRTDIPKEGLAEFTLPKAGVKYVDAGTEEYGGPLSEVINKLVNEALDKARR